MYYSNTTNSNSDSPVNYGGVTKHPSQYRTVNIQKLVLTIINQYKTKDQIVNTEKLVDSLMQKNIFKKRKGASEDGFWDFPVYVVNKKKLRRAIQALINKCLNPHSEEQKKAAFEKRYGFTYNPDIEDYTRENDLIESGNDVTIDVERTAL